MIKQEKLYWDVLDVFEMGDEHKEVEGCLEQTWKETWEEINRNNQF